MAYLRANLRAKTPWPENILLDIFKDDYTEVFADGGPDLDIEAGLAVVLCQCLTDRERGVVAALYSEHKTLAETGGLYGVKKERIRQIQEKALRKLSNPNRKKIIELGAARMIGLLEKENAALKSEIEFLKSQISYIKSQEDLYHPIRNSYLNNFKIDELGLSIRSWNCLSRAKIYTVGDLIDFCEKYADRGGLATIRNLGQKSYKEIYDALKMKLGFDLKFDLKEYCKENANE